MSHLKKKTHPSDQKVNALSVGNPNSPISAASLTGTILGIFPYGLSVRLKEGEGEGGRGKGEKISRHDFRLHYMESVVGLNWAKC